MNTEAKLELLARHLTVAVELENFNYRYNFKQNKKNYINYCRGKREKKVRNCTRNVASPL